MANNEIPCVWTEDDERITLPWVWEICGDCDGNGTHALHGIAITSDEWYGPDWDDESRETYLTGGYDTRCDDCGGSGKVRVVDEDHCDPDLLGQWREQVEADYEDAQMRAMERRMGC